MSGEQFSGRPMQRRGKANLARAETVVRPGSIMVISLVQWMRSSNADAAIEAHEIGAAARRSNMLAVVDDLV